MGYNGLIYCIGSLHLTRGIKMDFVNIRYLENDIYISLKISQEENIVLSDLKNIYVSYKIKAFHKAIEETVMIKRENLTLFDRLLILIFSLSKIHSIEETQIEIEQIKIIFQNGDNSIIQVNESFSLLEIQTHDVEHDRNREFKKFFFKNSNDKIKNDDQINQDGLTVIEKITPLSTVVSEVESKIERKLNAQTKKLEMDIKQLCYETIDVLLTSLPQPEIGEEYRASNAMVQSIHKYINIDLLQKEQEEGESV